jgi:ABC-type multidrug transport system ATPase subunit
MTTDVSKRRSESTVGDIGIIETGLSTTSSVHNNSQRCTLQRCEVISRTPIVCNAKNKSAVQAGKKVLLHPLRVNIPAGSITAVLGGAGSGKSVLLKFLATSTREKVSYRHISARYDILW